jgi:hypothetical protein
MTWERKKGPKKPEFITVGNAKLYVNLREATKIAKEAAAQDRVLFKGWVESNFPATMQVGVKPNNLGLTMVDYTYRSTDPISEVWEKETVLRTIRALHDNPKDAEFMVASWGSNGGYDAVTEDFPRVCFAIVKNPPTFLQTEEAMDVIADHSTPGKLRDGVMQSFPGAIVETEDTVCQVLLASNTFGFPIENRQNMPAALIMRGWRVA